MTLWRVAMGVLALTGHAMTATNGTATNGIATNGTAPPAVESLADIAYDDGWGSMDTGSVPALSAIPALSDEYPDIDWGGTEYDDAYGAPPPYQSLEEVVPPEPAATVVTVPTTRRPVELPSLDLPPETQRRIIELTAADGDKAYSAINADGPFRGRHGPGHKAYQRFHTGLSFGVAAFNQDSGTLGQLIRLMQDREPETFLALFGE